MSKLLFYLPFHFLPYHFGSKVLLYLHYHLFAYHFVSNCRSIYLIIRLPIILCPITVLFTLSFIYLIILCPVAMLFTLSFIYLIILCPIAILFILSFCLPFILCIICYSIYLTILFILSLWSKLLLSLSYHSVYLITLSFPPEVVIVQQFIVSFLYHFVGPLEHLSELTEGKYHQLIYLFLLWKEHSTK